MNTKNCISCGYEGASVKVNVMSDIHTCSNCGLKWMHYHEIEDENFNSCYETALETVNELRVINYKRILDHLDEILPSGASGLEVGSAFGLFLEQAQKRGYNVSGIEPMDGSYTISKNKGLNVSRGYFPEDINRSEKYDFIIFNDVFEHIPDLEVCIESCKQLLKQNGMIIINLPISSGFLFKISILLSKFGMSEFHTRMWNLKTQSPHLYYFNRKSLNNLMRKFGIDLFKRIKMKSFILKGLRDRIELSGMSKIKTSFILIMLTIIYPLIQILPRDTECFIYKPNNPQFIETEYRGQEKAVS